MLDRQPAEIVLMPSLRKARRRAASTRLFLALCAAMVLLSVLSGQPWASGARGAAKSALPPVEGVVTSWVARADVFTSMFGNTSLLRAENQRLRAADEQLRAQVLQLDSASRENAALRQALAFEQSSGYHMVAAGVVGRDPDGLSSTLDVDRGTVDGIRAGMVVVTGAGLLGRVKEAGPHYAIVQTLADPWARLDVELVNANLQGIVSGGTVPLRLEVRNPTGVAVSNGDWAITSGADGEYPHGLVVGEVTGAGRLAWVNAPNSVTFVLVITDFQPS